MRSSPWRAVLLLSFLVLGLLNLFGVVSQLSAQARLKARARAGVRSAVERVRPRLAALLAPGGPASWTSALQEVVDLGVASQAEAFTPDGRPLQAVPGPSHATQRPDPDDLRRLRASEVLVSGPQADDSPRILAYALQSSGGEPVVLRFSQDLPGLAEDLHERRQLLLVHTLVLLVLLVAGWSVFFVPARGDGPSPPTALAAYEEAMGRLRDQGEERHLQHEEERRRMEGRLQDHEAMARAGELTAGMVHEVRNGLGTIAGYARLLDRGAPAGTPPPEAVASILEECATLETVVRRFMEFVKRNDLVLAPCDLARLVERVSARECRAHAGASVHTPSLRDGEATVVGDEDLLERVLENLIRNAREAAGAQGHVWVEMARRDDALTTTISDDGPGLAPELRQTLRPFVTTKAGGLGLGLPLALKLVRLHGGKLVLGDRHPRGLRVDMILPVAGPPA